MAPQKPLYTLDANGNRVYEFEYVKPIELCPDQNCTIHVTYTESPNPMSPDATSSITIKVTQCGQDPVNINAGVELGLRRILGKASYFHLADTPLVALMPNGLPPYVPILGEVTPDTARETAFDELLAEVRALPEPKANETPEGGETLQ